MFETFFEIKRSMHSVKKSHYCSVKINNTEKYFLLKSNNFKEQLYFYLFIALRDPNFKDFYYIINEEKIKKIFFIKPVLLCVHML
jgi:hypothetical protein